VPSQGIVSGDRVTAEKMRLARELRRHMTPEEAVLWRHLRAHRLRGLHFRRQQVIDGFVVDFFCFAASLVVEVDGGVHKAQKEYDAQRDRALAQRGLRVLRVSNEDVRRDMDAVLARIASLAAETPPTGQAGEEAAGPAQETPFPRDGGTQGGP